MGERNTSYDAAVGRWEVTQPSKFKSKIDELHERLANDGRLTELSDSQIRAIDEHVSEKMREFRVDLRRKQAQSIADTARIVLVDGRVQK